MPEAGWIESRHHGELIDLGIVVRLCFRGRAATQALCAHDFLIFAAKGNYFPRVIETWPDVTGRLRGLSARGETIMEILVAFLHRYLSPFAAGACAAGATAIDGVPMMAGLLLAAVLFGFASLPAGGRMIGRIAGASS